MKNSAQVKWVIMSPSDLELLDDIIPFSKNSF